MQPRSVFGKFLHDHLRGIAGWCVGVAAITALYSSFWPTMAETSELMDSYLEAMPGLAEALGWGDMSSPAGYLDATVLLLVPILVTVAAIGIGGRAIAGDEEEGGLELVLAHPVSRAGVLLQRFAGMAVYLGALGLTLFLTLLLLGPVLDLGIGADRLAATAVAVWLIALCHGSAALAIGAATGRRSHALAGGALLAVIGYLGNTFALTMEELEWMRFLSPFYYGLDPDPLATGVHVGFTAVLAALSLVLAALATAVFNRRDVMV